MSNEGIKTSIEGLKNIKEIMELRAETLDCAIKTIERTMETNLPDTIKEYSIRTIVERYSEFEEQNEKIFKDNEKHKLIFLFNILGSLE